MTEKESFEKSLEKLEELVEKIESGELNLEEMIKSFEEGSKLVEKCSEKLNQVEQKIEKLIKMKIKIFNINLEEKKIQDYEFDTLYESNQIPNFLKR